jgi:dipeptidyl-peptidase-4
VSRKNSENVGVEETPCISVSKKAAEDVYKAYLVRNELVSGGFASPNWFEGSKRLWFVEGAPEHTVIMQVDLNSGKVAPIFDVLAVRAALAAATGHEPPYRGLPFDGFKSGKDGRVSFIYEGRKWWLDPSTNSVEREGCADPFSKVLGWGSADATGPKTWTRRDYMASELEVPEQLSPSGEWFASIRDHNIAVRSYGQVGRERRLTLNGTSDCYWDIEALRIKVSSGRRFTVGAISPWSPDSSTLLAYRREVTGVFRVPRVNWLKPFIDAEHFFWEMAGGKLDRIDPVFVDIRSGRQVSVKLDDTEDAYIQLLAWRANGSEAMLIVYARDFKSLVVVAASRQTGTARLLLTESSTTFVKVQHDAVFAGEHGFSMLPDDAGFLWLSTRDGWNHLYHYDMDGQLIGQLTRGDWPVHEVRYIGVDGFIYFTASIDKARPYDVHVCRIPLRGGKIDRLTNEKGLHTPIFSPGGQAFLDAHSSVDRPSRTDLVRADGTLLRVLSEMDIGRLKSIGYTPAEEFTVKAADGATDLWGVMYKPYNFDPSQSYPIIEYIYGGPQTVETPRYFAIDETTMSSMRIVWALAQLGYIVICLDARGTPGRSKAFHDSIYCNWTVGIPDHAASIRQLCARHAWMDANRVGITGHSWGGYYSTCALMHESDTYHAAVSYAPHYDPWDGILSEPYLDLPIRNSASYENASLFKHAAKVKGRLMIATGTADNGFGTVMKMIRALIEAGIEHELVVVPAAFHHFSGAEEDYFLMKLIGWFDRHVKNRITIFKAMDNGRVS